MNDVIKFGKKLFSASVVGVTIAWSMGLAAFVPVAAQAATCPELEAGDLFKATGASAVYYLTAGMERAYFPHVDVFNSWNLSFNDVVTVSGECLFAYPAATVAGINYRPGSRLVKLSDASPVFAVTPGNKLVQLTGESVAALYGTNWTSVLRDVSPFHWPSYTDTRTTWGESKPHDGQFVKKTGETTVYWVKDGMVHQVDGSNVPDVRTVSAATFATLSMAGGSVTVSSAYANPTQVDGSAPAPTPQGAVVVTLAANTPSGASVPRGAANVDVLKFNVRAGNTSAMFDEVTVKRTGTGLTTGLTAYIYDGERRVGSGRTFASDTNEAEFSVLNLTIPANTTKTLTVRLQVASTAVGNHLFSVTKGVATNATVSGLPVTGNQFTIEQSVTAGTLTVEKNGTLSNPTLGDSDVSLTQFRLTANSEDQDLHSFTLKQDGTMDTSKLSNLTLWQGSTAVPAEVSMNGRLVTFALHTPFALVDGASKIFTIKGNVSAEADTANTVIFFVERNTDFNAVGRSYGFGTLATITAFDASGDAHTLTLQGGGLTIANNSKPAHDVKVDSTEVELGKVSLKANSDNMTVEKMTVSLATTEVTSGGDDYGTYRDIAQNGDYEAADDTLLLRNIKLKDAVTGQTLGSAKAITDADGWVITNDVSSTLTFIWTDTFTIKKGETRNVVVVADIHSSQVSGVLHTATFKFGTGNVTVKDSKDNAVTDIVPASDIASNPVTTKTSGLTISRSATPETRTVVAGSEVDALGLIFAASAGTGNDVKVTGLTLDTYVDGNYTNGTFTLNTENEGVVTNANMLVETVSLYADGQLIAGPVGVDTNGRAIFTSSKFVGGHYNVAAGTNKNIVVKAKTSGNGPYGSADDAFAFTFDAADVTVEDSNGSITAEVTGTNVNGTTGPSVSVILTANGTITTAADSSKPDAGLLIAGHASEQEVNRVRLTATREAFNVTELSVLVTSSVSYDNVQYVQLYKTDGTKLGPEGGVTIDSSGIAKFTGLSLNVPSTGNTVVVVKAKLTAIGERTTATNGTAGVAADSGDAIYFNLDTTSGNFRATGVSSGTVDTQASSTESNMFTVRNTKPTVAISSLSSAVLSNGERNLMRFTVTADASADVVLGSISPEIIFSDAGGSATLRMSTTSLYVYDVTSGDTLLNATGANSSAVTASGQIDIDFDTSKVVTIAAGTTRTFEVRASFTGTETGDSIETRLVRDSAALGATTETFADAVADANDDFIWSDTSADTNGVGSVEWINGYLLNLPTSVSTISRS